MWHARNFLSYVAKELNVVLATTHIAEVGRICLARQGTKPEQTAYEVVHRLVAVRQRAVMA